MAMCVCVVRMYVYIYIHTCINVCVHMYVCMYVRSYVVRQVSSRQVGMYACMHVYRYVFMYVCACVGVCVCVCVHAQAYMSFWLYVCAFLQTYNAVFQKVVMHHNILDFIVPYYLNFSYTALYIIGCFDISFYVI